MSKRGDLEVLSDILEASRRIMAYGESMSYQQFSVDTKTQDAVIRNFEIIGEAAKNISPAMKDKYQEVAWSDLAKLRDKLIDHYFGIKLDIVWIIIEESLLAIVK